MEDRVVPVGTRFVYTMIRSDPHFGMECEVVSSSPGRIRYRIIGKDNWKHRSAPWDWIDKMPKLTPDEIDAIRVVESRKKRNNAS